MHTCIPLHTLKRSWHSCPWWMNAGNKNTPSMHHPRRQNATTSMVWLKNGHISKNITQNGKPGWGTQKKKKKYWESSICTLPSLPRVFLKFAFINRTKINFLIFLIMGDRTLSFSIPVCLKLLMLWCFSLPLIDNFSSISGLPVVEALQKGN